MSKIFVHYVVDGTPILKEFTNVAAAKAFTRKYKKAHPNPLDGSWVDFIFEGKFAFLHPYYKEQLK